ncbi:Leucyl/phenylalanyl-tRNA--protein transferase [Novipirellula galeiformis]|uniref:Leucyl/phenylalanyl-tRNA--protein transferase n=1 Tax=Novipirellula galeiformis TaxID=2528004 RepID=A0A5C6C7P9_9BACT|nr:leucyl/phenylalanyl-tRNA--protein transferase [Novipirellula galeiformis]TWU20673.1 Leucyl/phenylalanyl-tRNA--protein transferase [Novipirellula galeiformis]
MEIARLRNDDPTWFPPLDAAICTDEIDGLLAVGGDLSSERLLAAYRNAIFPWYDEDGPILWWSPDPRAVIFCDTIHVSKSMTRLIRRRTFHVTWNQAFEQVMRQCAMPRDGNPGTWILPEMIEAYRQLHHRGHAQSCEVWSGEELVGGIYGVTIGNVFCGESMFHRQPNASKLALISVAQCERFDVIDCQFPSEHLLSMGAEMISRDAFVRLVKSALGK